MGQITTETVNAFLNGNDPMERIITIECDFMEDKVSIIYINDKGEKRIKKDWLKPFLWSKHSSAIRLFGGNKAILRKKMTEYGIGVKALTTCVEGKLPNDRLENGYKYMFYAKKPMSNQRFLQFFNEGGVPVHERSKKNQPTVESTKEYMTVPPVEQYMISTSRRLFKGFQNYNDLHRMTFDLETQGLNPKIHRIEQVGIHTNRGFDKIISVIGSTKEELDGNELEAIKETLEIMSDLKPDIIAGHNSENFDWDFIIVRCEQLGVDFSELSLKYFDHPIYKRKKEAVLKLGGEVEYYYPTVMWGYCVLDSLHAARRAQAIDSNMKSSNLKYVTKYLNLKKPNRVYVPGDKITSTWAVTEKTYGFCDKDGDWYKVTEKRPLLKGYELVSGRYIVERYLLDDIWETDKVEEKLNESNFLVAKMLPTTFTRACTMGTAGIWKLIMLAWCYENNLAIPALGQNRKFVGGLSRLLLTGYVSDVVKLDYNSLYPSIILTWFIDNTVDVENVLNIMLYYVLSEREKYKGLKSAAKKRAEKIESQLKSYSGSTEGKEKIESDLQYWNAEEVANDKKQLPLKILGNSYFGSAGAPHIFPWADDMAAERTTCTGRQMLRLMIYHFSINKGYRPIVGDTDGFNFQKPKSFEYTDEHPYISKGLGRNYKKGNAYTDVEGDVAEFEDLYLNKAYNDGINMSGLGIDEYCDACIQFARKNYADLMPDGSTKKVGNTIKSRKMSGYLEKFIDEGVDLLLHGNGFKFLSNYYDYIGKIYNYQIPIKDIASKGNIKKSINDYIEDCKTLTKAGSKKSRQAWYELVIKEGIKANVSDTIYYINTGTKKGHSDVKRITHYFYYNANGEKIEITKEVEKLYKEYNSDKERAFYSPKNRIELAKEKYGSKVFDEDEIVLNCKLVPNEIIESEEEILCSDVENMEYNVEKYIEQFNKRITPLLVCFHPNIRDKILVKNPKDKQYFTEEESKLVSGFPNKDGDQDTFEALMTPEKKEIEFWVKVDEVPPFVKECNIDWDGLVEKYKKEKEEEDNELYRIENEKYLKALNELTKADVDEFENEGKLPQSISSIVTMDSDMRLYFKKIPNCTPSTGGLVFDDITYDCIERIEEI